MSPAPIRLLHVEDDLDILEIASMSLEMAGGFDVRQCENAAEALRVAPNFKPDVMLFDMMLPEMSGTQLLSAIRLVPGFADIPVIFMTARAQPHERRDLIDRGAVEVIVKPFDPVKLGDQIRDILATC
ncbi:response regulator [Loktanella sp. M215]|uniref:response regulator n=1 Tax=Loktanella sp. M215 TaxID=2675431 RepID=UPI001F02B8E3|nr:response regulator [Loktanella sp. M215]MCF7702339.1 response regulator [Loktanella sp. M215]